MKLKDMRDSHWDYLFTKFAEQHSALDLIQQKYRQFKVDHQRIPTLEELIAAVENPQIDLRDVFFFYLLEQYRDKFGPNSVDFNVISLFSEVSADWLKKRKAKAVAAKAPAAADALDLLLKPTNEQFSTSLSLGIGRCL